MPASVAVIGGGVSGLMCATRLQEHGLRCVVFDTGKNAVGGRASSRKLLVPGSNSQPAVELMVDHACQFFTAQRPAFAAYAAAWRKAGLLCSWDAAIGSLSPGGKFDPADAVAAEAAAGAGGLQRWVSAEGGMGQLWKTVAKNLPDVRRPVWVSRLRRATGDGGGWEVLDGSKVLDHVDFVVIAHNGKCADRLMASAGVPRIHRLLQCKFAAAAKPSEPKMHLSSLWMCLVVFDAPLKLPYGGARVLGSPELSWVANNRTKPGNAGQPLEAWSLLSTPRFGTANKVRTPAKPRQCSGQSHLAKCSAECLPRRRHCRSAPRRPSRRRLGTRSPG